MQREIPDYSLFFGRQHVSASGATQPIDEHVLKLYLRKEHKMNFPFAARPRLHAMPLVTRRAEGVQPLVALSHRPMGLGR